MKPFVATMLVLILGCLVYIIWDRESQKLVPMVSVASVPKPTATKVHVPPTAKPPIQHAELVGTYGAGGASTGFTAILVLNSDKSAKFITHDGSKLAGADDAHWEADSSMVWIIQNETAIKFLRLDSDLRMISAGDTVFQEAVIFSKVPQILMAQ